MVDTPLIKEQNRLLGTKVIAWSKGVRGSGLKPIVISGPSGVGKGILISKPMKEYPLNVWVFCKPHNSRSEKEKSMGFTTISLNERSLMEKAIQEGKFLESASVHENLYDMVIEAVEAITDSGKGNNS